MYYELHVDHAETLHFALWLGLYVQESTAIQHYLRLALLVVGKTCHPPQVTPVTAQPLKTLLLSLNLNTHLPTSIHLSGTEVLIANLQQNPPNTCLGLTELEVAMMTIALPDRSSH